MNFTIKRYKDRPATIEERQRLLDLLRDCKEKLAAYYKATGGAYPGGPLLSELNRRIDTELEE